MSSRLLSLDNYRRKRRKDYIDSYGDQLDRFIRKFVRQHWDANIESITNHYLDRCANTNSEAWDYLDMREALHDSLRQSIVELLVVELKKNRWFDSSKISTEELADRCVSAIVLEDWAAIS
jgi:hypothetical protein